jgi:hypothetical protein
MMELHVRSCRRDQKVTASRNTDRVRYFRDAAPGLVASHRCYRFGFRKRPLRRLPHGADRRADPFDGRDEAGRRVPTRASGTGRQPPIFRSHGSADAREAQTLERYTGVSGPHGTSRDPGSTLQGPSPRGSRSGRRIDEHGPLTLPEDRPGLCGTGPESRSHGLRAHDLLLSSANAPTVRRATPTRSTEATGLGAPYR